MILSDTRVKTAGAAPGAWWVFAGGLLLFLLFQTGMVVEVELSRLLPPEAKDAYRYIYSAVQMREGFNYHTPALDDLRAQSAPEPGDSVDRQNLKWDNYHSLFFTHYPLHSALLLVISGIGGVTLGTAYKIITVLGSLLIAGAIAYLLLTITDPVSAGLALGSLALTTFPMQGIHYVVPTNISMAVGLILFAVVLRSGGRAKWLILLLTTVVLFLHRAGIVYAGLGVLAAIFLRYKKEDIRRIVIDLTPTLAVVCLYVLITYIFPLPMFRLSSMAKPPDTNYFKEVLANFGVLLQQFGQWFLMHGVATLPKQLQDLVIYKFSLPTQAMIRNNWLILVIGSQLLGLGLLVLPWLAARQAGGKYREIRWLISLGGAVLVLPILSVAVLLIILRAGWLHPPQEKKTAFYLAFFFFLGMLFPSLLHVMYIAEPGHPIIRADLTTRLWVPCAVVLAGLFGRGLWWMVQEIRAGSYDFLPGKVRSRVQGLGLVKPRFLWAALALFLVAGYAPHLVQAYETRADIKYFMIVRQNVTFDPGQVQWVFNHTGPKDIVVYDDDFIRHYYLCHGGLTRRAIYLSLLPLPENFHFAPDDIKYEIGWNPYLIVQHYENVRAITYPLIIPGGSTYRLNFESQFQPQELRVLPASSAAGAASTRVRLIRQAAAGVVKQEDVQIDSDTWQTFPLQPDKGGSLTIINLDPAKPFLLAGMQLGEEQRGKFLWPWHGVTEVSLQDARIQIQRSVFLPEDQKIGEVTYDREVLQDTGSTVLWKLTPAKHD